MELWDTACLDWKDRLLLGKSLIPRLPYLTVDKFRKEAEWALRVFKRLILPDVIGTPTMEVASGEWFFGIVAALFGAYDVDINRRMIQEIFILVPKKNGKSSYAAAIMVVAIILNRRPLAEFLLIAPTKKIAEIAFKQAKNIIKGDEELCQLFLIQDHIRTITHLESGAVILIQAADTDVITGSKSTGILVDETHVFAKMSKAADVFVEIRGALASRPDGFMLQITTQSKDPPTGVFKDELERARDVRDGKLALPLLMIGYELPDEISKNDGWLNEKYWPLVNPNLNRSVDLEFLRNSVKSARTPEARALLASQHFNVQIGLRLRADRWRGADFWEQNSAPALTMKGLLELSDVITVGIDGGGLDDLLSLTIIGRHKLTRKWLHWSHAWAYSSVLELRKEIAPKLQELKQAGELTIVETANEDVVQLADIVEDVRNTGLMPAEKAIGVDPAGISEIVDELKRRDITVESGVVIGIKQGWSLSHTIKSMERRLAAKNLLHCNQALMAWAVGNAKVEPRGNNILIEKQAAGVAKIDPLLSTFNAASLMELDPIADGIHEPRIHYV